MADRQTVWSVVRTMRMSVRAYLPVYRVPVNVYIADMISDNEPMWTRFISVPKDFSQLNCGAFIAGIVESILEGSQFVSALVIFASFYVQFICNRSLPELRPTALLLVAVHYARLSLSNSTRVSWTGKSCLWKAVNSYITTFSLMICPWLLTHPYLWLLYIDLEHTSIDIYIHTYL